MKYIEEKEDKKESGLLNENTSGTHQSFQDFTQEEIQDIIKQSTPSFSHQASNLFLNAKNKFKELLELLKFLKPLKSLNVKNLDEKSLLNSHKENLIQQFVFNSEWLAYKKNHQNHHKKASQQYCVFYDKRNDLKTDLDLYFKLLKHNGIADIPNPYFSYLEDHFYFHQDFLFCDDVDSLFQFFLKTPIRQKEIAQHYDLIADRISDFEFADKLKEEIEELKTILVKNKNALENYFENRVNNKEKIQDDVFKSYDKHTEETLNRYKELTEKYNELINDLPQENDIKNDYAYFLTLINSANIGLLTLAYGDGFLPSTTNLINLENLQLYFLFSLLLSEDKIWKKYNITTEKLKENVKNINQYSNKTIFIEKFIEEIVNYRAKTEFIKENNANLIENNIQNLNEKKTENIETHNSYNEFYYQYLIQNFDLEYWMMKVDLLSN